MYYLWETKENDDLNNCRFRNRNYETRRERTGIFEALKEKNAQPRILYPVKKFINESEIKTLLYEG